MATVWRSILEDARIAVFLLGVHLHDDRRDRHLDRGHGDLVVVPDVVERAQMLGPGVQIHRHRAHCGDGLDVAPGAVPQNEKSRRAGGDEIRGAGEQRIVHHRRAADIGPIDGELEPGLGRLRLDQLVLLHHVQRQESEAAGTERDPELADLGRCRDRQQHERRERQHCDDLSHRFSPIDCLRHTACCGSYASCGCTCALCRRRLEPAAEPRCRYQESRVEGNSRERPLGTEHVPPRPIGVGRPARAASSSGSRKAVDHWFF